MRKNICETTRREFDELMLGDTYSAAALDHLQQCSGCREFEQKQTKLRQMVGSLGTVAAPADFDFRLRARLANDSSGALHLKSASWMFARRGLAVAAALLLFFATGVVVLRSLIDKKDSSNLASGNVPAVTSEPSPTSAVVPMPEDDVKRKEVVVVQQKVAPRNKSERPFHASVRPRRNIVSDDFSSEGAVVLNGAQRVSDLEAFPIDASLESFKISLDDGRGNARTISLPPIRFGSQRMLPSSNQSATKGVW